MHHNPRKSFQTASILLTHGHKWHGCSKVVVIADGEKKFDGTPAELKAKDPSGKLDVVFRNLTMKA